jgi:hypothetical protein
MFGQVADPAFPALSSLSDADLARITGAPEPRLLRARYQPGARAILHIALGSDRAASEGAIWFYAGGKGRRLGKRLPDARFDAATGALFEAFPNDHRMPLLAEFVAGAMTFAPDLIGGPARHPPELMRYRPGLSATFRWTRQDGKVFFVKQTPSDDVAIQAQAMRQLCDAARHLPFSVCAVAGVIPGLGLIAYEGAEGQPLDELLCGSDRHTAKMAMARTVAALRGLWSVPLTPSRCLDRSAHLNRAEHACQMIGVLDPSSGQQAALLLADLKVRQVPVRLRPIHADMKLDHAFLSGSTTTLIDTESLSLGDPDYDLAKLEARLRMAVITGRISPEAGEAARAEIRQFAGPHYDWFLICAKLQCAKFFAQRLDPVSIPLMQQVMA